MTLVERTWEIFKLRTAGLSNPTEQALQAELVASADAARHFDNHVEDAFLEERQQGKPIK